MSNDEFQFVPGSISISDTNYNISAPNAAADLSIDFSLEHDMIVGDFLQVSFNELAFDFNSFDQSLMYCTINGSNSTCVFETTKSVLSANPEQILIGN